jgi:DNA-binding response OmpR family regulator
MVARTLVEHFGCAPLVAPTGEAAISLIRRDDRIDLVVLDLAVPDMDGIVTVQLIRALGWRGAMPIVVIGGDAEVTSKRGRAAGFAGTVRKPYSPRELYGAMHTALTRAAARMLS